MLGMIQQLRNAVVAPTSKGENYGRIMPLLRQGCLVTGKITACLQTTSENLHNIYQQIFGLQYFAFFMH